MSEEKVDRRGFLKTLGAGIGGLVVGLAGGYAAGAAAAKPAPPTTVTKTETVGGATVTKTVTAGAGATVTETATETVTKTVSVGATGTVPALPKIPLLPPGVRNPYLYDKIKGAKVSMMVDSFAGRIIEWYADLLKEEVGVEIGTTKLVDIPMVKDEAMGLLDANSTDYPLILVNPNYLPDFVLTGKVEPLDKYLNMMYGFEEDYLTQVIPIYKFYMTYQGTYYAIPFDGDVHLWNYLWPFYEKEEFRTAYREWHPEGKPLVAPPETWDEWLMQCKFFKEKVLPDDKTIPGAEVLWPTMIWASPDWAWGFYFNFAASYGVNYWDKDMTTPLYPQDRAIAALEMLQKFVEYMPEGVDSFGATETVEYWCGGKVISQIWWIDINEWGQVDPVKGYLRNGLMPGYPDPKLGKVVHKAMTPYNRYWIVPNYLDDKTKLAAFYVAYHVSHQHYSIWSCADMDCGMDPYMWIHMSPTGAECYMKGNPYKKPSDEWPHKGSLFPSYEDALLHLEGGKKNLEHAFPLPCIPGCSEYGDALGREVQLVIGGKDPKQAISDAAAAWEDTRDKYIGILGKDTYLGIWHDFLSRMTEMGLL